MNEIAPHFRHPILKKPISEMVADTDDISLVVRWNPGDNNGHQGLTIG
jgi:hypothetical protein